MPVIADVSVTLSVIGELRDEETEGRTESGVIQNEDREMHLVLQPWRMKAKLVGYQFDQSPDFDRQ